MSDEPEAAGSKQALTQFKPGQSGNPKGRAKGSRNKLGEDFVAALHEDFVANGLAAIISTRTEHPDIYLKVIASVVPKELNVNVTEYETMSDSDLDRLIESKLAELTCPKPAKNPEAAKLN